MGKRDQVLRFAVGTPDGPRSGTWRLWVPRGKSDTYLSRRTVGRNWKVSLHNPGPWQLALTSEYLVRPDALQLAPLDNPRGVIAFARPLPQKRLAPCTRAFTIVVPWLEVIARPGVEADGVTWTVPPPKGFCVQFDLIFVPPEVDVANHPVGLLIDQGLVGEVRLANGERGFVVSRTHGMTTKGILNAQTIRSTRGTPDGRPFEGGTVLAFGIENSVPYFLDVTVPENPEEV
jgi:hypothetical protein